MDFHWIVEILDFLLFFFEFLQFLVDDCQAHLFLVVCVGAF